MNATAAVRGLFRAPRAGPNFLRVESREDETPQSIWHARAEKIGTILYQSGYSTARLSVATRERFGADSPYFIPPTFLSKLRNGTTPHVCQIAALSECTGYRFVDWLRLFAFDLHQIPRLQTRLHTERTVPITPIEDAGELFRPWNYSGHARFSAFSDHSPSVAEDGGRRYWFVKIGSRDAEADPRLLPGSIVRIDRGCATRRQARPVYSGDQPAISNALWLVELPGGLTCSAIRWIDDRQIALLPPATVGMLAVKGADRSPDSGNGGNRTSGAICDDAGLRRQNHDAGAILPAGSQKRRASGLFGVAPGVAPAHRFDLQVGAPADQKYGANPGQRGLRDRLGPAFGLRGYGTATASYREDSESLRRLLHGCMGATTVRRRVHRRFR